MRAVVWGDLTVDEQLALAGLLRLLVRMDGELSPEEVVAVSSLARDLDAPDLWRRMTDPRVLDMAEVARLVELVRVGPVREWMYGVLVGLAAVDGLDPAESELLDWLRDAWALA